MKHRLKHGGFLIIILILVLIAINYSFFDEKIENLLITYETGFVERVVDGDTIKINDSSYRLLGINTPEKGELYSEEAKQFLESQVLNQTVKLFYTEQRKDLYSRDLVYVVFGGKNINEEIVRQGFANVYYPSKKDSYYPKLISAWQECLENNVNFCEKSLSFCSGCIELKEFDHKKDLVVLENTCSFNCDLTDWSIKDEGRKNYVFDNTLLKPLETITITAQDFEETYVWTDSGDTLFLRDGEGRLVLWESY